MRKAALTGLRIRGVKRGMDNEYRVNQQTKRSPYFTQPANILREACGRGMPTVHDGEVLHGPPSASKGLYGGF